MDYIILKFFQLGLGINRVLAIGASGDWPGGVTPLPGGETVQPGGVYPQVPATGKEYSLFNPLGVQTISTLIDRVAGYLIVIAAPIATIMILIGAFYILTAGDNPEKVKTGKQIIMWAVIGYAIILISKGITLIIAEILGAGNSGVQEQNFPLISV